MSSTNRGGQRHNDDFYRTPAWVTKAIMPYLPRYGSVLDPCCGDGAILDCFGSRRRFGIEIDEPRSRAAVRDNEDPYRTIQCADALGEAEWPTVDLIITNPPFALAEEFVRHALRATAKTATPVAMLLRLAFLESQERIPLHQENVFDLYPLSCRPSFTDNGKTDSCAYAWFVWRHDKIGCVKILTDRPPRKIKTPRAGQCP